MSDQIYKKFGQPFIQKDKENKEKFAYNQTALAHKFVAEHQLCYDLNRGQFARYSPESGLWEHFDDTYVKGWLAEFVKGEAGTEKLPLAAHKITSGLLSSITEVVRAISPVPAVAGAEPGLFPVANGVLNLTGTVPKLAEFEQEHRFSTGSKIEYNAKAQCPLFKKQLLGEALEDEDIDLVQRYFGSVLLGPNQSQRFLILRGTAGGGKSTLVSVLENVIGFGNVANLRTEHLSGRFETAGFLGKRLLTGKDVPGDSLKTKGAQLLKALVGGDRIEAERKFVTAREEMIGNYHVVIAVNNRLTLNLDGDEDAWRRRLLIVEFSKPKAEKPIRDFSTRLIEEEGSGILNWLVEGAVKYKQEQKKKGDFILTDDQQQRVDDMIDESQPVKTFVSTRVVRSQGAKAPVAVLTDRFLAFCKERKWTSPTERQFENELPRWMLQLHHVTKRNDIRVKDGKNPTRLVRGFKDIAVA